MYCIMNLAFNWPTVSAKKKIYISSMIFKAINSQARVGEKTTRGKTREITQTEKDQIKDLD